MVVCVFWNKRVDRKTRLTPKSDDVDDEKMIPSVFIKKKIHEHIKQNDWWNTECMKIKEQEEEEVVKMFMTFGFLYFYIHTKWDSLSSLVWCLLLLLIVHARNFWWEPIINLLLLCFMTLCSFHLLLCDCDRVNATDHHYIIIVNSGRGEKWEPFGICHHRIKVVKNKRKKNKSINKFIVSAACCFPPTTQFTSHSFSLCDRFWIGLIFFLFRLWF